MSDKPTESVSLFSALFGGAFADSQSPEGKEYRGRLEAAARWLAAWETAEASNDQKETEPKWIN